MSNTGVIRWLRRHAWVGLLVLGVILVDQISKNRAASVIINSGLALGWGGWFASGLWWSIAWSLGVIIILIVTAMWFLSERQWLSSLGWAFLAGGGASNLWDRWMFGGVRDWWQWGELWSNNLADFFIGFGITLFVINRLVYSSQKPKP